MLSCCLAACAPAASASSDPIASELQGFGDQALSWAVQLGPATPTGTNGFNQAVRGGGGAGLQILCHPNDWLALGAEAGYSKFPERTRRATTSRFLRNPSAVEQSLRVQSAALLAVLRIHLAEGRSWTPYLLGGAGMALFDAGGTWIFASDPGAAVPVKARSVLPVIAGGAGLEAFLARRISLALEARLERFRLQPERFGANSAESLRCLLGLRFWY